MSHSWRMLVGCVLPFLLIFALPLLGVSQGITLFAAMALMFGCHLLMMRGHYSQDDETPDDGDHHAHS